MKKILIGDDDEHYLRSRVSVLEEYTVDLAFTPEQVIEKAKQNQYDVIVTDLNYTYGGKEGFKVLRAVKELAPVRVLSSSIGDLPEIRQTALESGATHVANKKELAKLLKEIK